MKLKRSSLSCLSLFLAIFIFSSGPAAIAQDAPLQGLDEYVNRSIRDWDVPGVAIAVIKDDKIIFAKGFGVRETGKPEPVDARTMFAIGSSSKAFTAASLAMLVDEGKIKWDDPATKYLPGFQLFDPYATREMTVRDLLTHRVGLERGDQIWYATPYSREEVMRRIRFLPPSSSFRSKFGYQNIMYLAAGEIVPSVTGKSWDDFVRERIFVPLGMNETNTSISRLTGMADVAAPHQKIDDKVIAIPYRLIDNIGPAGSINSNVTEMSQWVRLQLGKGTYEGKQLIKPDTVAEMQSPQTIIRLEGQMKTMYPEAHFLSYGMGWFLSDFRGRKMVEHGGAIDGMRALVAMIPEENIGAVILTNRGGTILPQPLAYRIFDALLGVKDQRDWSGDMLKSMKALEGQAAAAAAKLEANRVKGTSPSLPLERYAGDYQSDMYGDVKISLENGKLMARFGPYFTGQLEHWHYDVFRVTWKDKTEGKSFISFRLDQQGKVAEMNMSGLGDLKRVPEKKADAAKQ